MEPRWYEQVREIERDHWWFVGRRRILLAVLAHLDIRAETILDVGCGTGANLELLRQRFDASRLCGIDLERSSLRGCRGRVEAALCCADLRHPPFRDESFDLVCALDAIEHVEDDEAALRRLHGLCRPGASLLATVPAFPFLWGNVDRVGHHFRRYRRRELLEKIEAAGFEIRFVRYFNTALFPAIAAVRLLARALPERADPDGELRTDFDLVRSGPLNGLLARVLGAEAAWPGWSPPFGVSLLCVARRP